MFLILFRYTNSTNYTNSWEVLPNAIYFEKDKVVRDVNSLNYHNQGYEYKAYELKEVK